ncbi:MAG: RMD1 family protein [Planctomycetes bacterium]|nr:RMD1 family protein [Planctomycetota bacterium]
MNDVPRGGGWRTVGSGGESTEQAAPPAAPAGAAPRTVIEARAILVGSGLDITALGATERTGGAPLVLELVGSLTGTALPGGGRGVAVLYRSGAAVFFDVTPAGIAEALRQIAPRVRQPLAEAERDTEVLEIAVDPAGRELIEGNTLLLADVTMEKLQIVADILAKSVSLAHHERAVERQFERVEPFAADLGRSGRGGRELLRQIGSTLLAEHQVVAGARVDDTPELLWDHPELERLWGRLRDEFEIRERSRALHDKLALVSRTAETALDLLHNTRSLRLEWAVVGLIVCEILLTLLQWGLGVAGHGG